MPETPAILPALLEAIERHGHDVAIVSAPAHGVEHLTSRDLDAVVAAGGDGTIASVALKLRGSPVPLAILPLGTANNIAVSLGVPRGLDEAIASWAASSPLAFDVGVATGGGWGERLFVESVGGGLVTHGIAVMDRQYATSPTTAEQVQRALRTHLDVLAALEPRRWSGTIDDAEFAGDYLLLEVLNTSAIGPNLAFAPGASPCDGQFTVVAVGSDHREAVAAYLRSLAAGEPATFSVPTTWQGTAIEIAEGDRLHIDDDIVGEPEGGPGLVRIAIEPGAVQVLAPSSGFTRSARAAIDTMTGWPPAQTLLAPASTAWRRAVPPSAAVRRHHHQGGDGQARQVAGVEGRAGGAGRSDGPAHGCSLG